MSHRSSLLSTLAIVSLLMALGTPQLGCRGRGDEAPAAQDKPDAKARRKGKADGPDEARDKAKAKAKKGRDRDEEPVAAVAKGGGEPTVIFIVMDTVRADHLSACGYDRPTSPVIEGLVERTGAAFTCNAYSSATWTVPSHASYFTGLTVPEHESDSMGFTFSKDVPVLAGEMRRQGYQSVMISANPTLSKESGLQRAFETVRVAKSLVDMREEEVPKTVRRTLKGLKERKPLFLFVNLLDAHDPYPRIPPGVGWVPPRPTLPFDVHDKSRDEPYHRFILGEMDDAEADEYVQAITDGYDYGISLADRNVGDVMQALRRDGWLKNGFRLVITSDHGEFLGEHQLLRHGCFTWEPVTKVPFLYYDSTADEQIELPEPFSAINAFWLTRDGRLPDEPQPVLAFSKQRAKDIKVGADMATLWLPGHDKVFWQTNGFFQIDLEADPGELNPQPMPEDHDRRAFLEAQAEAHAAHLERVRSSKKDPEMVKALEALGYVE